MLPMSTAQHYAVRNWTSYSSSVTKTECVSHHAGQTTGPGSLLTAAEISVYKSGYPLSGYPDLSVNFMAAKNPDILK